MDQTTLYSPPGRHHLKTKLGTFPEELEVKLQDYKEKLDGRSYIACIEFMNGPSDLNLPNKMYDMSQDDSSSEGFLVGLKGKGEGTGIRIVKVGGAIPLAQTVMKISKK